MSERRKTGINVRVGLATAPGLSVVGLLVLLGLNGCSPDFMTTEADVTSGGKTRPFAIVLEPAEAGPGEVVDVTMYLYEPDPTATAVTWQAALDYDTNIYLDQVVEDVIIDLDEIAPLVVENGVATQRFRFTIPDSTLLVSSAVDDLYDDPFSPAVSALFQPTAPGVLTKGEIDRLYSTLDPQAVSSDAFAELRRFADHFVCQIRLRATIHNADQIEVTKNVTVRYSSRFESPNVNKNPVVDWVAVLDVDAANLDTSVDIDEFPIDTTYVYHRDPSKVDAIPVTVRVDHSYFMAVHHDEQSYRTPVGTAAIEDYSYNWYFVRQGANGASEEFLDWNDSRVVLLKPTDRAVETYQILTVVRDFREEWDTYDTAPGSALQTSIVRLAYE